MLWKLRPSYQPPSVKQVSSTLLENVYVADKKEVQEMIKNGEDITVVYLRMGVLPTLLICFAAISLRIWNFTPPTKYVKARHQLLARFREERFVCKQRGVIERSVELELPTATRWYSSFNCIQRVVTNKPALERLISKTVFMSRFQNNSGDEDEESTIANPEEFIRRIQR